MEWSNAYPVPALTTGYTLGPFIVTRYPMRVPRSYSAKPRDLLILLLQNFSNNLATQPGHSHHVNT